MLNTKKMCKKTKLIDSQVPESRLTESIKWVFCHFLYGWEETNLSNIGIFPMDIVVP
jgi:hypothetical protein